MYFGEHEPQGPQNRLNKILRKILRSSKAENVMILSYVSTMKTLLNLRVVATSPIVPQLFLERLNLVRRKSFLMVFELSKSVKAFSNYVIAKKQSVHESTGRKRTNSNFHGPCH